MTSLRFAFSLTKWKCLLFSLILVVVNSQFYLKTFAGVGTAGSTGDNSQATSATVNAPFGVYSDTNGVVYVAELTGKRIRKIATSGIISTYFQTNAPCYGVMADTSGVVYASDYWYASWRYPVGGPLTRFAGGTSAAFSGDGGAATSAKLSSPNNAFLSTTGDYYISDSSNSRIRVVVNGIINTFAGNGTNGFGGDNGPATAAPLSQHAVVYLTLTSPSGVTQSSPQP